MTSKDEGISGGNVSEPNDTNEVVIPFRRTSFIVLFFGFIALLVAGLPLCGFAISQISSKGLTVGPVLILVFFAFFLWLLLRCSKSKNTPGLVIDENGYTNYIHKAPKDILWSSVKYFDDDLLLELGRIKVHTFDKETKQLEILDVIKSSKLKINNRKLFKLLSERHKNYLLHNKNEVSELKKTEAPTTSDIKPEVQKKASEFISKINWPYQKENSKKYDEIVGRTLSNDEKLMGVFTGCKHVAFVWFFIVGPLAPLGYRNYLIAVTSKAIHFHLLGFVGQHTNTDILKFDEIRNFKIGQSRIVIRPQLSFYFNNGNEIDLQVIIKSRAKNKNIYLNEEIINHLKNNIQEV
ncbi:MAG: hypothetical protein O2970_10340 [Proteobacteria bacterium]|nr:hypothetical protein [Pseudomonadota bacterium]MDA0967340.1 hypothetical protein [Pseudomonadota bacterium]